MKFKEFIATFSHNNEISVQNVDDTFMLHRYRMTQPAREGCLMDWELEFTDISDCEVICIRNVIGATGITIKIDTKKLCIEFLPQLITLQNAPLWLYNETHKKNIQGREKKEKGCLNCWHNYHCPMPQEGYNYNPDDCPYLNTQRTNLVGLK